MKKYHTYVTGEVKEGNIGWADQVRVEDAMRYLNSKAHLSARDKLEREREREPEKEREEPAERDRGRPKHRNAPRLVEDSFRDPFRFSSEPGKKRGTCRLFNFDRQGCTYGRFCQYNHWCSFCDRAGAPGAEHRAMECGRAHSPAANQMPPPHVGGGGQAR